MCSINAVLHVTRFGWLAFMETCSNIKALVIEDDPEMANLLKRIISNKFSMQVELAFDCATARRKLADADYDMITLDYRLPDGAGLDLLDEITEGGRRHPPVIMVTGHGDEETAARSFRSRASGYVVKDARLPEMLVDAVQKALAEISLKRIEEELLEEKVFIEDALNGLPDMFAVVDMEGKFFRWNEKVSEVTGYTNAEISRMNIIELFSEEDREKVLEGMKRLREEGLTVDEFVLETKSGERRVYELSGRLLRNFDGIPMGYSGIGRDVTDRVEAGLELSRRHDELRRDLDDLAGRLEETEGKLEEAGRRLEAEARRRERAEGAAGRSEASLHSVLANSMDIIAIFDAEGTAIEVSPSITGLLGYEREQIIGKKVFELVHPDDFMQVLATHESVAVGDRETNEVECRFLHRSGSWHALSITGRGFQSADGEFRIVVNARDVTESHKARKAMRESEERYHSFFSLSPDLIYLIEMETGRILDANEAMLARSGKTLEELSRMHHADFFSSDDRQTLAESMVRLRDGESIHGLEVSVDDPLGKKHVFEINATPLYDGDMVSSVLAMAREITGRKQSEEELRVLNAELEGYAQTVSHDLQAPLTAIKLAADNLSLIMKKYDEGKIDDLNSEVLRIGQVVGESTSKAEHLISDLLQLARAGQEPEEVSLVDVADTIERVIEEHAPIVRDKGVTIVLGKDLGKVRANPVHIYQLFSNLIDNSLRYNNSPEPTVEVSYAGGGGLHRYRVQDNGPGIPAEDIDKIFLPFYKGTNGSTGIGLAIVDKLVKLYDGDITVRSNGGVCFEFSLNDMP